MEIGAMGFLLSSKRKVPVKRIVNGLSINCNRLFSELSTRVNDEVLREMEELCFPPKVVLIVARLHTRSTVAVDAPRYKSAQLCSPHTHSSNLNRPALCGQCPQRHLTVWTMSV